MKKEILIHQNGFHLNFFYDERSLSNLDLKKMRPWLNAMTSSFVSFLNSRDFKKIKRKNTYLNLNIVSDYKIKKLNFEFRNKNKVTDVLSFPMQENMRTGEVDVFNGELELGDLFICKSVCAKQAREFNLSFNEEFVHLAAHGFLHVLGFDHEVSSEEEKLMEKKEAEIIKNISKSLS